MCESRRPLMERVGFYADRMRNEYARKRVQNQWRSLKHAIMEQNHKRAQDIDGANGLRVERLAAGEPANIVNHEIDNKIGEIQVKYDAIIATMEHNVFQDRAARKRGAGFFSYEGGLVGRDYYPSHHAIIERNNSHPMLRCLMSKLPRGRKRHLIRDGITRGVPIAGSNDKKYREIFVKKTLALDMAWIESNPLMRGIIRIDIDRDFDDEAELIHKIRAQDCPLPNIITWKKNTANKVDHPHLYYVLENSVCWTDKGRNGPKRLFLTIQSTITRRLASIGADPYGGSNSLRGKNPLSPLNISVEVVPHTYRLGGDRASADNLSALLNLTRADYRLAGRKEHGTSNEIFSTTIDIAKYLIRDYHPQSSYRQKLVAGGYASDIRLLGGDAILLVNFKRDLERKVSNALGGRIKAQKNEKQAGIKKKIAKTCSEIADRLWGSFDPSKEHQDQRRHIMRCPDFKKQAPSSVKRAIVMLKEAKTVQDAESAGAHFTAAVKREGTIAKLVRAAIDAGIDSAGAITADHIRHLVEATGISRRQCYAYRADLPPAIQAELNRRKAAMRRHKAELDDMARDITARSSAIGQVIWRIISPHINRDYTVNSQSLSCAISPLVKKDGSMLPGDQKFFIGGDIYHFPSGKRINDPNDPGKLDDLNELSDIPGHDHQNCADNSGYRQIDIQKRATLIYAAIILHLADHKNTKKLEAAKESETAIQAALISRPFAQSQDNGLIRSRLSIWHHDKNFNDKDCDTVYLIRSKSSMCDGPMISVIAARTVDESNIFTRERISDPREDLHVVEKISQAKTASGGKKYYMDSYGFKYIEYMNLGMAA
ncbi:MAG: hypothetical protein B7Z59_05920 [Acidiphilium sp. 37-67-22]|nr:MAG: hypothetical protein B7Z59_05920 [Acidiphilium sp. 37-67-22]